MLGYEYVSLTPEQVEARRKLLDQAGYQAYLLPIILLSTTYAVRLLSKATKNSPNKDSSKKTNTNQLLSRRIRWLLTETYVGEFGQLHVQLLGLVYTFFLLSITFHNTGNDYMHATKAFGHVAISQLPIHFLLSIKHPKSPITLATGLTHERLNAYHRLFGRIVHSFLITHAILYMRFFIAINVLSKRIKDWDVRYGLMAIWTVNFIGLLSIPPIRRKLYHRLFYRSHVLLSLSLLVIVWLHVPYTRNYVGQAAFFWAGNNLLWRRQMSEDATVRVRKVGKDLLHVTALLRDGKGWTTTWVPGMHGYLNTGVIGPKTPFTVVDVSSQSTSMPSSTTSSNLTSVSMIIRNLNGPLTSRLDLVTDKSTQNSIQLTLEGPYGEAQEYMPDYLSSSPSPSPSPSSPSNDDILIVAGGVGATYALPIFLALSSPSSTPSQKIRFVWIVKTLEDARWGIESLSQHDHTGGDVNIYTTTTTTSSSPNSTSLKLDGVKIHQETKRPDFDHLVKDFFDPSSSSFSSSPNTNPKRDQKKDEKGVTIFVCGPPTLSRDLRNSVTRHQKDPASGGFRREVNWFEERFGFGGS